MTHDTFFLPSETPIEKVDPHASVFGIIADHRAGFSRSPVIFDRVMRSVGFNGMYLPFEVRPGRIGEALRALKPLGINGVNVTVPYKETVMPYLDILSEGANIIGAVNTIVWFENRLKGYNTNAIGFMDMLSDKGIDMTGRSAVVIGTGGMARAAAFILNWLKTDRVYVVGRSAEKIGAIVKGRIGGTGVQYSELNGRLPAADLVVNATAVSTAEESASMAERVRRLDPGLCRWVIDLNYGRPYSVWQEYADRSQAKFSDGLPVLARSARRSFFLWTRHPADQALFDAAVNENQEGIQNSRWTES